MANEGICPGCGRPLPADGLKGLCPECLMKAGFGTGAAPAPDDPTGRPAFTPPSLAEVARLFPQLEVVELLGQGGMGAVYKARQPALDRWVALKLLPPQTAAKPGFSERFNREARALAHLSHPHIVAVHEFGQVDGLPYFIMEYVDGVTLRQLVQTKKLAPEQALAIVPQICEALQFAHDEGIVHRDIKPENILLDKKGRVKIADFGIAKIVEGEATGRQPITQDQQVIGTPHYMAPEQVEKPHTVDHRADIYSLGVVFYEMLTGELPLGKFAPPSGKVQVDVRLDEVVLHALEKEPERRYQQASELKTDVETIATSASSGGQGAAGKERRASGREMASRALWQHNPWELTITVLGSVFFVVMLLMFPAFPHPFTLPMLVISLLGLGICALTWAGLWPFPSPFFPEPNFSSRNLRRGRTRLLVALGALLLLAVPLVSMLVNIAERQTQVPGPVSRASVIRAEETVRRAILERLAEGGWKPESLSVSVSPDLRRAECRFGKVWKNGLTQEPFNAEIRLVPQGGGLWLVEGTGEFHALRFSVDTSPGSSAAASTPGTAPTLPEGRLERPPVTYETATVTRGPLTMQILEAGKLMSSSTGSAQWEVYAELPETSVVHVQVGQEVECIADAFPGRVLNGKVTGVNDSPDRASPVTYTATVQVINPGLKLREGMSVRLAFIIAHRPDVLRMPSRALLFHMPGTPAASTGSSFGLSPGELAMADAAERATRRVWVLRNNNEPEPVQIRIGITDGHLTEVVEGLKEGEKVIIQKTAGSSEAQSDTPVDGPAARAATTLEDPGQSAPVSVNPASIARHGADSPGFGPVIERVLRAKDECFLDLDTGRTFGPAIIGGETDLPPGMDLSIPYTQVGTNSRADKVAAFDDLEVQPATSAEWDLSSADLSKRMQALPPRVIGASQPAELANRDSELPRTYLFRTSPQTQGVLQILAFTKEPPGVKLRYRLLRSNHQ